MKKKRVETFRNIRYVQRPTYIYIILYRKIAPVVRLGSLGPRPSPLRVLLRAFNCAGEGNIENGEGLG